MEIKLAVAIILAAMNLWVGPAQAQSIANSSDILGCDLEVKANDGRVVARSNSTAVLLRQFLGYKTQNGRMISIYGSWSDQRLELPDALAAANAQLSVYFAIESEVGGRVVRAAIKQCHYASVGPIGENTDYACVNSDPFAAGSGYQPVSVDSTGNPIFPDSKIVVRSLSDSTYGSAILTCNHVRSVP